MADTLLLVTQITSLIAFSLLVVALVMSFISFSKFTGEGKFKRSILIFIFYIIFFSLAVMFMSLYHWIGSELMENLWYVTLNLGLLSGIVSSIFSISFYRSINFKKKK